MKKWAVFAVGAFMIALGGATLALVDTDPLKMYVSDTIFGLGLIAGGMFVQVLAFEVIGRRASDLEVQE